MPLNLKDNKYTYRTECKNNLHKVKERNATRKNVGKDASTLYMGLLVRFYQDRTNHHVYKLTLTLEPMNNTIAVYAHYLQNNNITTK